MPITRAIRRPDLGTLAYAYMLAQSQQAFIGTRVMPLFGVKEKTAQYPVIPLEALLKIQKTKRAPRGKYGRSDYEFIFQDYNCEENGWEESLDDTERKLYRNLFDAEEVATQRAMDVILRAYEQRVANTLMSTSNAVATHPITTAWNNKACTPLADITAAKKLLRSKSGLSPNAIVIGNDLFEAVMLSDEIANNIKFTTPFQLESLDVQRQILARYLKVETVLVGDAIVDTATKGKSATLEDVWTNSYVALARLSSGGNNLQEPAFGRTFLWEEYAPDIINTESYREEQTKSDIYRCFQHTAEAVTCKGANLLLTGVWAGA